MSVHRLVRIYRILTSKLEKLPLLVFHHKLGPGGGLPRSRNNRGACTSINTADGRLDAPAHRVLGKTSSSTQAFAVNVVMEA